MKIARALALLAFALIAPGVPPAASQTCRWDGTAPFCDGECRVNETEITRVDKLPPHWVSPFVNVEPPFGAGCATGSKALCCSTPGKTCHWDGSAPFCKGKCTVNEEQTDPPPGSRSGAGCATGSKVYCCTKVRTGISKGPLEKPDSDQDGRDDVNDNCPFVANPDQLDTDHDSRGDACDNCPLIPNKDQLDTDFDKLGDVCDEDDDNDGCTDAEDQHPKAARVKIGTYTLGPLCPSDRPDPVYGSESSDTDHDGQLDCKDADDDNDGVLDDADPCPTVEAAKQCLFLKDCPGQVPWDICHGGGCVLFFLKLVQAVNPPIGNPQTEISRFDRFWIEDNAIHIFPGKNGDLGVQEVMRTLSVVPAGGLRLEIWTRGAEESEHRLRAVVAEYGPGQVVLGQGRHGATVRLVPPQAAGTPMLVEASERVEPLGSESSGTRGGSRLLWAFLMLAVMAGLAAIVARMRRAAR